MEQNNAPQNASTDDVRESGQPGGGAGRREEVGRSGVYPASGPWPEGDAPIVGEKDWGQGERGAAGYEDHGESELNLTTPGADDGIGSSEAATPSDGGTGQSARAGGTREEFPNQETLDEESQIGYVPEDQEQLES